MRDKKPCEEPEKTETSHERILLREMLDAQVDSKTEDELADAEALFKKSTEEEQERIADFSESIEDIAQQSHPEPSYIEHDPIEPAPQTKTRPGEIEQDRVPTELTADFDQLVSEADADTVEPNPTNKSGKLGMQNDRYSTRIDLDLTGGLARRLEIV
jgi:hypothetical protein